MMFGTHRDEYTRESLKECPGCGQERWIRDGADECASCAYDGSYVENHCGDCGEFESECLCEDGEAA